MIPDLAEIARIYRQGMTPEPIVMVRMVSNPRRKVAEHFGVPESTANRWIRAARESGDLGPATNGKAGEA